MYYEGHAGPLTVHRFLAASQHVLCAYGDQPVTAVQLYRTPIPGAIQKVANFFQAAPDTLFHLAMICRVGNRNIVVEKTAYPRVSLDYATTKQTEVYDIFTNSQYCGGNVDKQSNVRGFLGAVMHKPVSSGVLRGAFTLNMMLNATKQRMGTDPFFSYDAFTNNCQDFIRNCLMSIGCLTDGAMHFLYQHAQLAHLQKKVPAVLQTLTRRATDIGNIIGWITGGRAAVWKPRNILHPPYRKMSPKTKAMHARMRRRYGIRR